MEDLKGSTTKVQALLRGLFARRAFESVMETRETAATIIQKIYRGFVAYDGHVMKLGSSIYCQALIRRYLAKKELDRRRCLRRANDSATRIQTHWRSYKACSNYSQTLGQVTLVQAFGRGLLTRRAFKYFIKSREMAAVVIQKMYRGFVAYEGYVMEIANVIYCQAIIRQFLAKNVLARLRHWCSINGNATRIQSCWRSYKIHMQYTFTRFSVISVQSFVQGHTRRRKFREMLSTASAGATRIQSCWRSYKANTDYAYTIWSIIAFQSLFRGHLQVRKYHAMRWLTVNRNATKIQSCWRSYKINTDYAYTIWSVVAIQSLVRGHLQLRKYHAMRWLIVNDSAVKIQSTWRSYKASTDYAYTIWCVITLQSLVRSHLQLLKYQELRRSTAHECATKIQSRWRSYKANTDYAYAIWGVIAFQSLVRGHLQIRKYGEIYESAMMIQSCWRGHLQLNKYQEMQWLIANEGATKIQSCWRCYKAYTDYAFTIWSVISLQSFIRGLMVRKFRLVKRRESCNAAAITIQSAYRSYLHYSGKSSKLEPSLSILPNISSQRPTLPPFLQTQDYVSKLVSAITIQSWWRLVPHTRRNLAENQRIAESLENAAATAIVRIHATYFYGVFHL